MSEAPLYQARMIEGVVRFGDVTSDVGELLTHSNCFEVPQSGHFVPFPFDGPTFPFDGPTTSTTLAWYEPVDFGINPSTSKRKDKCEAVPRRARIQNS